ncbi:MAG: hypothetical protein ACKOBM_17930, partial [Gammaproteobacteria bacterium]
RRVVAKNPRTPHAIAASLFEAGAAYYEARAKDSDEWGRFEVAANPRAPLHLLARLCSDKKSYVRETAQSSYMQRCATELGADLLPLINPERPIPLSETTLLRCLSWLTGVVPGANNKDLTNASRDRNWLVRLAVAAHADASEAMLELLSGDSDAEVAGSARRALMQRKAVG